MHRNIIIVSLTLGISACGGTMTGPVTGTKYRVTVGTSCDQDHYEKIRKEALRPDETGDRDTDCKEVRKQQTPY